MSNLINFDFESNQLRTILIDNNPWFVAEDVCNLLSLTNPSMTLKSLDDDERSKLNLGRQGDVNIINESGLYVLILRCRDAVKNGTMAYRFRKWVTNEVLPSIRKTGSYSVTINTEQQYEIKKAVSEKSFETGIHYRTIYTMLYDEFKIPRYEELLAVDFDKAIKFIQNIGKLVRKCANDDLPGSRAFALALMRNGARRYDEITRAYGVLLKQLNIATDNLNIVIDQIGNVKKMITHIDLNDGAVHDGFAEARLYLFMDDQIRKASIPIADKMYKPLDFTNI